MCGMFLPYYCPSKCVIDVCSSDVRCQIHRKLRFIAICQDILTPALLYICSEIGVFRVFALQVCKTHKEKWNIFLRKHQRTTVFSPLYFIIPSSFTVKKWYCCNGIRKIKAPLIIFSTNCIRSPPSTCPIVCGKMWNMNVMPFFSSPKNGNQGIE